MPTNDLTSSFVPKWPSYVVVLMMAWGIVKTQGPIDTRRPSVEQAALSTNEPAKTHARLWQDPIATASDHARSRASASKDNAECCFCRATSVAAGKGTHPPVARADSVFHDFACREPVQSEKAKESQKPVAPKPESTTSVTSRGLLILPVIVSSSPYDEGSESRIRCRYAVLSGLALRGFEPLDNEHLSYYFAPEFPIDRGGKSVKSSATNPLPDRVVPYEWFQGKELVEAENSKRRYVLVLWIRSELLGRARPLATLADLMEELRNSSQCAGFGAIRGGGSPDIRIMGPNGSDLLHGMVAELDHGGCELKNKLKDLVFYSTQATSGRIWDRYKRSILESPGKDQKPLIKLTNYINNDDVLVEMLVKELHLRPGGRNSKVSVAIIGEWDTEYSRGIVEAARTRFTKRGYQLAEYTYMRGLDGKVTENDITNKQEQPKDRSKSEPGSSGSQGTIAAGRPQVDYLYRLVDRLQSAVDPPDIIFLAGSDVYDKLMILRAVRPLAPQALFITTDIDARLLDPEQYQYAHKSIIASHFDLHLEEEFEPARGLAPFRDSYQTALCRGTLSALEDSMDQTGEPHHFHRLPPPVLHEIGRSGAYLLTPKAESASTSNPGSSPNRFPLVLVEILLAFAFVCLLRPSRTLEYARRIMGAKAAAGVNRTASVHPTTFLWISFWGIGAVALMVGLILTDIRGGEGEPFLLFEGISSWPTEFLRLLICFLTLYASFSIQWASDTRLAASEEMFLETNHSSGAVHAAKSRAKNHEGAKSRRHNLAGWLWADRLAHWQSTGGQGRGSHGKAGFFDLWSDFKEDSKLSSRVRRTLPFVLVYTIFTQVLVTHIGRPLSPVRGLLNSIVDMWMLYLSVLATTWILFFVWDATRLCSRFVGCLESRRCEPSTPEVEWWQGSVLPSGVLKLKGISARNNPSRMVAGHFGEVSLVASLTETVGEFISAPFIVLLLMGLSRNRMFDNWTWPASLVIVFLLSGTLVLSCSFSMRRAAESMRRHALRKMRAALSEFPVGAPDHNAEDRKIMEAMIQEVTELKRGAFCSLLDNPALRAALIPFLGLGTISLLDQLRPFL